MSSREALIKALDLSFPTVLTSGSILSAAGFLIGQITTEPSIVGIGQCLSRGTLISMFLVMFVLPQILVLGDPDRGKDQLPGKAPRNAHHLSASLRHHLCQWAVSGAGTPALWTRRSMR